MWKRGKLAFLLLSLQFLIIVVFTLKGYYGPDADGSNPIHSHAPLFGGKQAEDNDIERYMGFFSLSQVCILIGIGLAYTGIKSNKLSGFGFPLLLHSLGIQWVILWQCWIIGETRIRVDIEAILFAQRIAAASVITLGILSGKCSVMQLVAVVLIECPLLVANRYLNNIYFDVNDVNSTMSLILFAVLFGVGICIVLCRGPMSFNESRGDSQFFNLASVAVIYALWPEYSAQFAEGDRKHRVVVNTFLCISSAITSGFALSSLLDYENRFSIRHLRTAAISGAVAVGSSANLMLLPYVPALLGLSSTLLSTLGQKIVEPFFQKHKLLHDSHDIFSSFGIPAVLSGIITAFFAAIASQDDYGYSLYVIFPQRAPRLGSADMNEIQHYYNNVKPGVGRTTLQQATLQLFTVISTLIGSLFCGAVTGLIIRHPVFEPMKQEQLFDDATHWVTQVEEDRNFTVVTDN